MTHRRISAVLMVLICALATAASNVRADGLLSAGALDRLSAQRYWELNAGLERGESVSRIALVDDNLYLLTTENRVFAIHALTGIVRWSRIIAERDQAVRGPSHNKDYVFFTTGGSVTVLNRRTGDAASRPRSLDGVVIEVRHDTATISLGAAHGVRPDDTFKVFRVSDSHEQIGEPIAYLHVDMIYDRSSRGRLERLASLERARTGDRVTAEVVLPFDRVKLPFAASSAALADEKRIYVGAANQRFYALDILAGFPRWQLLTPRTVSATPVLDKDYVYFAGQDGRVVCCTKEDRVARWTFQTEGPVFADLLVEGPWVFVASSDRSLYCLDRESGRRLWRRRFDTPPTRKPVLADGRVYLSIPNFGLFVHDAKTGDGLWHFEEDAELLAQFEKDAYLLETSGAARLLRVEAATGSVKLVVECPTARFGIAMQSHQAIILATERGELLCLRSKTAPRLRPSELADVLRSDEKIKMAARMDARRKAELAAREAETTEPERPLPDWLMEDDFLSSRSTAVPVGGRGLVDMGEPVRKEEPIEAPPRRAPRRGEDEDEDEDDWDDDEDEGDEDSDDGAMEDDADADDDKDDWDDDEDEDDGEDEDPFGGEEPDDEEDDDDSDDE